MAVLSRIGLGSSANDGTGDNLRAAGAKINACFDLPGEIMVVIDGGGAVITTGLKGYLGPVPYDGVITQATLLADQGGAIVIDVWKCTYAQFDAGSTHPVDGDSITASAPPTITATNTKSQDSTLTGWTSSGAFSAGDVFAFNVDSVTSITRATLTLKYTK